ncbi:uroporphyrinogen-III C-methyltransferase [Clostridium fessum]|uniref:uroporphyrinogen-III C-methyltransferase n=1 Tax=Clostridium fessum TaxID=2126740 RepID=UPI002A79C7DC|nr:uroporphyrinogen-III C-methyltransferase [Clostridium fessum]MDY2898440.1 uroporphyrinogen-III C-methyltransferase [Candidatus Limivivens sp.]MDY4927566.1 uroporphyrinogen-III C-methyltransferase [Clostridium fessum]
MKGNKIIIGSRESRLAVIQSQMVQDFIKSHHPDLEVELLTMKTTGDIILDRTLDKVGGKGLFVKELDRALSEGRSDLSVHSLKDMPMEVPEALPLVAFSKREDPRDVLVLPEGVREPDFSKPIGCSSLRRILQLKELFPKAEFRSVRGNVLTRLQKLDSGEYGALVLAAAGLKRLGLENRISRYFEPEEVIPAAGQGILAVQGRQEEGYGYLSGYDDRTSRYEALCERAFVRTLNGGCSSPVAAHARVQNGKLFLMGLYYDEETGGYKKGTVKGNPERAEALGRDLAIKLRQDYRKEQEQVPVGKVWLVGAGPGDPGLFTLKGKEVLSRADVVVYDALVGSGVLTMIPKDAELINVGKRSSNHLAPQETINRILVEEAKKGKRVVRLKGGDPFLFGRGGEEMELLKLEKIPCEVVPGVTSAIAVPAYNGIPVTHRDFCSSVHIITGHKKKDEKYDIDFEALVRTKGTLVFLMGVKALPDIMKGLLENGCDPFMPAAILQKGTLAGQKRIVATVSTLEEEVERQGVETPAIIVVGKVCDLAQEFAWYEELPLAGKKILVTRPRELVSVMSRKLREKGAEVLELPAICTVPIPDNALLQKAIKELNTYQWLVFTSPSGVRIFFDELRAEKKDIRALAGLQIAALGSGTAKVLESHGLYPELIPEIFDGEALGKALAEKLSGTEKLLIPRAALGGRELIEELQKKGVVVDDIPTYDTLYETPGAVDEKAEFDAGTVDYAVFTSASTVRGFEQAVKGIDFSKVKAVCIGRQTKAAADALGMETYMAEKATMDSVVACVEKLCSEKQI